MSDEGKTEAKTEENAKPEPMEQKLRRRIYGAVEGEIKRLSEVGAIFEAKGDIKSFTVTLESIASIKARAEMYCVQIEMAAQTAAMASMFNAASRKQPPGEGQGEGGENPLGNIADVLNRVRRPGGNSQPSE